MNTAQLVIVALLAVVGLGSSLSGAVGVVRMPDFYSRIQCSTKTITMGLVPALLALLVATNFQAAYWTVALLVAVLMLVLNPATSHALVRAGNKIGIDQWDGAVADESEAAEDPGAEPTDSEQGEER